MTSAEEIAKTIPFSGEDSSLPSNPLTQLQYTSPEWHEYDLKQVFGRRWLFAGHASQIKRPGDFFTFSLGRENVIVSRTKAGGIKAFHNSCRHRGTQVCQETSGRKKYFTCPFHGWAYDLEGQLKVAPMMPDTFDELVRIIKPQTDLEEWGEPDGADGLPTKDYLIWTADAGPGMREGAKTFSMDGQFVTKKLLGDRELGNPLPCAALSWFPALGFFVQPDYAVTTSWLPTSPTTSVMRSTWLVHEDAVEGVDYTADDVAELIDVTNEQDKALCRLAQLGVNSSGYDNSAPYQPQLEAPVRGFLNAYLDHIEDGEQPAGAYR